MAPSPGRLARTALPSLLYIQALAVEPSSGRPGSDTGGCASSETSPGSNPCTASRYPLARSLPRSVDAVGALVGSELRVIVMAGVVSLAAVLAEGAGAAVRGGGWGTAGT